tara:strand:- start:78 stop:251 length:174 start_codon:yes stop_codon:yes gene_type:complete
MLGAFALGHITVADIQGLDVRIEGDATILSCLEKLLDDFPAWFPITTHDLKFGEKNL